MGRRRKPPNEDGSVGKKRRVLPPCRVCSGPAAGFHYGANTCEACKGFFHRSLGKPQQYQCEKSGDCEISHTVANMCQSCRLNKCLSVGMSKQAIKTGRYTDSKRSRDRQELMSMGIKHPQQQQQPQMDDQFSQRQRSNEHNHIKQELQMGGYSSARPDSTSFDMFSGRSIPSSPYNTNRSRNNSFTDMQSNLSASYHSPRIHNPSVSYRRDQISPGRSNATSSNIDFFNGHMPPNFPNISYPIYDPTESTQHRVSARYYAANGNHKSASPNHINFSPDAPRFNNSNTTHTSPSPQNTLFNNSSSPFTNPHAETHSSPHSQASPFSSNSSSGSPILLGLTPTSHERQNGFDNRQNMSTLESTSGDITHRRVHSFGNNIPNPRQINSKAKNLNTNVTQSMLPRHNAYDTQNSRLRNFISNGAPYSSDNLSDNYSPVAMVGLSGSEEEGAMLSPRGNDRLNISNNERQNKLQPLDLTPGIMSQKSLNNGANSGPPADCSSPFDDLFQVRKQCSSTNSNARTNSAELADRSGTASDPGPSGTGVSTGEDEDKHGDGDGGQCQELCVHCSRRPDPSRIPALYTNFDQVVTRLLLARKQFIDPLACAQPREMLIKLFKEHMDACKLKSQMFGPMRKLPDDEYDEIYASTGIDSDGRLRRYEAMMQSVEKQIRCIVKFARTIPGFSQIDIVEKVNLIKKSRLEFIFMAIYRNMDVRSRVALCSDGRVRCHACLMMDHSPCEADTIIDVHTELGDRCQRLELSRAEETLLQAIVLTRPDKGQSGGDPSVPVIHKQLKACLWHVLSHARPNHAKQHYDEIIGLMSEMGKYAGTIQQSVRSYSLFKYPSLPWNPILMEMLVGAGFDSRL